MKKGRIIGGVVVVVVIVVAIVLGITQPWRPKEPEVIKIGAILPLTGNVAVFGGWIKEGIELGLEELYKKNPELEGRIIIVFEDSQNDAKVGISALNKLIEVDDVDIVITAMSKVAVPLIPITEQNGIPLLLQDVTYPDITEKGELVFRHFIQSDREATILSEYAGEELGIRELAILYVNDEAGVGAKEAFKTEFARYGTVLIEESYEVTDTDIRNQIVKIMDKNPEAIFLFGNGPSWANAIKEIKELGYEGMILTNTAMFIPNFREIAGANAIEGVIFTYPFMDIDSPTSKAFVADYEERFGAFPPIEAAYGYDLILFIGLALEEKEGATLYDKLAAVREIEGAFGKVNIEEDGDFKTKVGIGIIENGEINTLGVKE